MSDLSNTFLEMIRLAYAKLKAPSEDKFCQRCQAITKHYIMELSGNRVKYECSVCNWNHYGVHKQV